MKIILPTLLFALASLTTHAADPVALFDGSTLDAWTLDKPGAWIAKDGLLQPAEGGVGGYVWTEPPPTRPQGRREDGGLEKAISCGH